MVVMVQQHIQLQHSRVVGFARDAEPVVSTWIVEQPVGVDFPLTAIGRVIQRYKCIS
jgi:hypothetical protein